MPNAPRSARPRSTSSGMEASRSICALSMCASAYSATRATKRSASATLLADAAAAEPLGFGHALRRRGRPRIDQVQPQPAEEQLLAEARLAPLGLPRGF